MHFKYLLQFNFTNELTDGSKHSGLRQLLPETLTLFQKITRDFLFKFRPEQLFSRDERLKDLAKSLVPGIDLRTCITLLRQIQDIKTVTVLTGSNWIETTGLF